MSDLPDPKTDLGRMFRQSFETAFARLSEKRGASQVVWHAALFEAVEYTFDEIDARLRGEP